MIRHGIFSLTLGSVYEIHILRKVKVFKFFIKKNASIKEAFSVIVIIALTAKVVEPEVVVEVLHHLVLLQLRLQPQPLPLWQQTLLLYLLRLHQRPHHPAPAAPPAAPLEAPPAAPPPPLPLAPLACCAATGSDVNATIAILANIFFIKLVLLQKYKIDISQIIF